MTNSNSSRLSGWAIMRAVMPPWQSLADPLVQYDIRDHRRAGRRPWVAITLAYLTLIILNIYLAGILLTDSLQQFRDLIDTSLEILVIGMIVTVMFGHWRLLLAISSRAAATIAARRGNGDWELIAITPVEKAKWLRAQIISIGWQVFPIVRMLLVLHLSLVVIGYSYLVYTNYQERQDEAEYLRTCQLNNTCYAYDLETQYIPTPLYALLILPYGLLFVVEPFVTTALFAITCLYTSSRNRHTTMSLLFSFLADYGVRIIVTMVLLYGGFIIAFILTNIAHSIGLVNTGIEFSEITEEGQFFFIFYCCFGVLLGAFFIEFFPAFVPPLFIAESTTGQFATLYTIFIISFFITYILTPLVLMHILGNWTVWRLNLRER